MVGKVKDPVGPQNSKGMCEGNFLRKVTPILCLN